ncbi:MAG: alcohol dehydrogenase, partial [Alphaproteobacteria bacterium]|nr:alcohol dehydrogenase [Alphaproteobacteria bacterium]
GDHNLCRSAEQTIVGRQGGFADRVRSNAEWAIPLPDSLDAEKAGPLFCGGATVFNPIMQHNIRPTDRVGVIGIGGLGHLALQFLNKWGCEVTAFTSSPAKSQEAIQLGAHHTISSKDDAALGKIAGSLDFILNTVNVNLNWSAYIQALAPRGIFHTVGVVPDPIPVGAFDLIASQRSISGSPVASPEITRKMVEFSSRHQIAPVTETFALADVNAAIDHLHSGKAKYRLVLKA